MHSELGGPEYLILDWQPHAKMRPRISRGGGRTHQDPKDKAAEVRTREALQERKLPLLTGNVFIGARFYRATRQVVDLDNLLKHILDCGNGILWVDDSQITMYSTVGLHLDRDHPRTEFWYGPSPGTSMLRGTDAP